MAGFPKREPTVPDLMSMLNDLRSEVAELRRLTESEPQIKPKADYPIFSFPGELPEFYDSGPMRMAEEDPREEFWLPYGITMSPPWLYHRPVGYLTAVKCGLQKRTDHPVTIVILKREPYVDHLVKIAQLEIEQGESFVIEDDYMEEVEELESLYVAAWWTIGAEAYAPSDLTVTLTVRESVD